MVARRSKMQRYCTPCSEKRAALRAGGAPKQVSEPSPTIQRGLAISRQVARRSLWEPAPFNSDTGWTVSFKVPFTQAASKNHVWSLGKGSGHVFKRAQTRTFEDLLIAKTREACRDVTVHQNKIWIEIFVQKPHHRGDAINVVDVVCDGLKKGLGVDDRWFCLRGVDWEIAKENPQIFVTVRQSQEFDAQACSHCGRILSLDHFKKKRTARLGVDRVCGGCRGVRQPAGVE